MIQSKHVRKTEGQKADGSLIGIWNVENEPACEGCVYYALLGNNTEQKACHYILVEGHRRPCDPGKDCTVKKLEERPEYDPGKWCHDGCGKERV